jgi:hypothetical protein
MAMDFYLLEQDLRLLDIAAVGGVPEWIDPLDWLSGYTMPDPGPLRVPLSRVSGPLRTDIMGSLLNLFSDALKDAMNGFGVRNIDYFPIELENRNTNEIEGGYWLANIVGRVSCLDYSRSVIQPRPSGAKGRVLSFHIDPDRAGDLKIFRLAEQPLLIIIRAELHEYLASLPLVWLRMRHTSEYDGY